MKQSRQLTEREQRCKDRGWHRVRYTGDEPPLYIDAVCIDCATIGSVKWATPNLLLEYDASHGEEFTR